MSEVKHKILSIGAHPDDADTSACGLLYKLYRAGWDVRMLSITDGSAGTYHEEMAGDKLAQVRKKEAEKSGKLFGGRYDVMSNRDGQLVATLELREELIRYIRNYNPDIIITNRPNDYHADHRNTALLVQDASFLLTVPFICKDAPYLKHAPVILYWEDDFKRPYPFQSDIIIPVSEESMDMLLEAASCHESQYFDWMYWPDHPERMEWSREKQREQLRARFARNGENRRKEFDEYVTKTYGDAAKDIKYVSCYEICEYGEEPSQELLDLLKKIDM